MLPIGAAYSYILTYFCTLLRVILLFHRRTLQYTMQLGAQREKMTHMLPVDQFWILISVIH
jgi:hypothetical protein